MSAYQKISSSLSLEFDDDPYPLKEDKKVRVTRRQLRVLIAEACGMDMGAFEL